VASVEQYFIISINLDRKFAIVERRETRELFSGHELDFAKMLQQADIRLFKTALPCK
jgi:hypothetical protein